MSSPLAFHSRAVLAPAQIQVDANAQKRFGRVAIRPFGTQQEINQLIAFASEPVGQQGAGHGAPGDAQAVATQSPMYIARQ